MQPNEHYQARLSYWSEARQRWERRYRQLGNIREEAAVNSLVSLYGSESDKGIRSEIINSFHNQNAAKPLVDIARKETDPELKRQVVQRLSNMRSKEATDYLMELLK